LTIRLFSGGKHKPEHLQSLSDEQLAKLYSQSGDMEILGVLYGRYLHLVFPVCLKYLRNEMDAEDMVMLVFEKLVIDLRKDEIRFFKGWLYRVVKNQCLMQLRHNQSVSMAHGYLMDDLLSEIMETGVDPHLLSGETTSEMIDHLLSEISRLGEAQRRCIELFYLESKSYQEVSLLTGFTMNEVKSHIQNGKRNLRIILEKARNDEN